MDVTADGPDVGLNDNMFFGVLDGDDGFGGGSTVGPGDVGGTATLEASFRNDRGGRRGRRDHPLRRHDVPTTRHLVGLLVRPAPRGAGR